ncbi:ABC transporter ATP-binding protein [Cetobacterium sp. 2A]|uniref:ABC transporter ATP-binding protein n=1 Tax=Cetobacterium sp. 2A TaxID=2754723 RepID=UPI00163C2E05|nr:ABC transporter ATP-binding protein [Cetobacterium sp. 2A]MBC2854887.1 ABC transporter ATP-binding protein [Cetobacterium sp. 2A]
MDIKIENLMFSYRDRQILKGIDIEIKKGKMVGILGPNGCGKSTFLKNILGYLTPDEGKIVFSDLLQSKLDRKEIAKLISLVPQKSNLMATMSVEDFVLMGRLPHLKSTWEGYSKYDKDFAKTNLEFLGLEKFKDRIALSLSGGEFQRVLLARALTQEPQILLLDEPTSALDLNHAVELLNRVKNLVEEKKLTSVIVLHDLNLASMFCDELIMMKEGKVVYQGAPKDVLTEENLKEVYNLKSKIIKDDKGNPHVIPLI